MLVYNIRDRNEWDEFANSERNANRQKLQDARECERLADGFALTPLTNAFKIPGRFNETGRRNQKLSEGRPGKPSP